MWLSRSRTRRQLGRTWMVQQRQYKLGSRRESQLESQLGRRCLGLLLGSPR